MVARFAAYGPWGLAVSAFLTGCFVPNPSEAVLIALVALGRGALSMTLLAAAANTAGGAILLAAGRAGHAWAEKRVGPKRLASVQVHFRRFGPWLLLMSWIPFLGDAVVLTAGALRVPWRRALPPLFLGKAARYAAVAAFAVWLRSPR